MATATAGTTRRGVQVRPPAAHGVTWTREVPAAWQERLAQVVPNDGTSWLVLRWEPGEPWWPIERWALWQVRPRSITALLYPDHLAELDGPNPRESGHACFPHWCKGHVPDGQARKQWAMRWIKDGRQNAYVDYWQWKLYHETGGKDGGLFGTRWWVIQGEQGGNRWKLSQAEQKLRELKRQPSQVPVPGSLPYADFDERTVQAILAEDKLRRGLVARGDLAQIQALRDRLEAEERAATLDAAEGFVAHKELEAADAAGEFVRRYHAFHGDPRGEVTTREERIAAAKREEAEMARLVRGVAE